MELRRLRIDPFSFALAVLIAITLAFFAARNGAAVVMGALCLTGVLAGRLSGLSNRALVPLVLGLVVILWFVWVDPPAGPRKMSALAHLAGGALAGWALAETLRGRLRWPAWAAAALAGVLVLAVLWELGEWAGDGALDTSLDPNLRDSAIDVLLGVAGAAPAVALSWAVCAFARAGGGRS